MKKIILISILLISSFFVGNVSAEKCPNWWNSCQNTTQNWENSQNSNSSSSSKQVEVIVTTDIPWANCKKDGDRYICTVTKWSAWVTSLLWKIIRYFTLLVLLFWILFIVINGILYSMWWTNPELKTKSKDLIIKTLVWIVILFLSWYILYFIAPWVYVK